MTQGSEENEGRVTKRFSKEFSRTENRIRGAFARLDDFLMNPLIQGHSGTTPDVSRNGLIINQGTNEDDPQSDLYAEARIFGSQTEGNSGTEDEHYMVTGATERHDMVTRIQRERFYGHDMMTGATEQIRSQRDMVRAVQRGSLCQRDLLSGNHEVTNCSPLHLQESKKITAPQVIRNSAVKKPLRQLRQTNFCWRFSNWQITTILQIFITILKELPNCQRHLRQ